MLAIFAASFAQVFLLGLNSQFVRDQRVAMVFIVSWFISVSQFVYTKIVATSGDDIYYLFFASAMGGSMGIVCSIYFYRWFTPILQKWLNK